MKIELANFMSWKTLKHEFDSGITLFDGWNFDDDTSEGCGKSAILNGLCWGFFGKMPKDTKIDDVISYDQKKCMVQIELDSGIFICRSRKPNDLVIRVFNPETNGFDDKRGKDAKETQKMIEDLIGLSFESFCQSIYFAQNYQKKFITSNQEDKGKILSEIQDLQVFDKARKTAHEMIKLETTKIADLGHQVELLRSQKYFNEKAKVDIEDQKKRRIDEAQRRVNGLALEKSEIKSKLDSNVAAISMLQEEVSIALPSEERLNEMKSDVEVLVSESRKLDDSINQVDGAVNSVNNLNRDRSSKNLELKSLRLKVDSLTQFINNPTEICNQCGTALGDRDTKPAEEQRNKLMGQVEELTDFIHALTIEIEKPLPSNADLVAQKQQIQSTIQNIKRDINSIEQQRTDIKLKRNTIENLQTTIVQFDTDIIAVEKKISEENAVDLSDLDSKLTGYEHEINKVTGELDALVSLKDSADKYKAQLETLKLGFREIKSHVFNSVLHELTIKSNRYLVELFEMPAKIVFKNDDMKILTEIELNGHSTSLGLLSGGQFRRTCFAVDLALSDIVLSRKGCKLDLRMLDEYFKDLSEGSMIKCLNLLEKLDGSTVLIEHNSIFKSIVDKTVKIELTDGISKAV